MCTSVSFEDLTKLTMPVWADALVELRSRRCLFMGGGGYKTLSFLGVLEVLGWEHFSHVSGVSAGSVLALLLCLRCSPSECMFLSMANEHILQGGFSLSRLCHGQSPMDASAIRAGFSSILASRGVCAEASLADLAEFTEREGGPRFSAICFCLSSHKLVRFAAETHPAVKVVDLLLASVAIPMLFAPIALNDNLLCCDAGLINSCPLSFFDPCDTVALLARWRTTPDAVSFPQTINLRCSFTARMSAEMNRSLGMEILLVPFPQPGVSLLSRTTTPLSAFIDTGAHYIALYVLQAELVGALAVMLCCPCSSGQTQLHGPSL